MSGAVICMRKCSIVQIAVHNFAAVSTVDPVGPIRAPVVMLWPSIRGRSKDRSSCRDRPCCCAPQEGFGIAGLQLQCMVAVSLCRLWLGQLEVDQRSVAVCGCHLAVLLYCFRVQLQGLEEQNTLQLLPSLSPPLQVTLKWCIRALATYAARVPAYMGIAKLDAEGLIAF